MKAVGKALLVLIVLEVGLGGGGRLIDIGWFSPRMWLFSAALAYVAFMLGVAQSRIAWEFACLILGFFTLLLFHGLVSIVKQVPLAVIAHDAKPQLYFPMLAFFAITIRTSVDVETVSKLLKSSAVLLSIAYLGVLSMWYSGIFTFEQIQDALNPTGDIDKEFHFRGDVTFFFKASLFVGVGLFFFLFHRRLRLKAVAILLFLALLFTLTRGLIAALFLSLATWCLFFQKTRLTTSLGVMSLALALGGVLLINELAPTAATSIEHRLADMRAIAPRWEISTLLIGSGLGPAIGARGQIEMNYVEILFKQGLLGLAFWFLPIVYMTIRVTQLKTSELRRQAAPYYLAGLFVYFENLTNPFLTNPIGLSVVLVAMVALRVLSFHDLQIATSPNVPAMRMPRSVAT